MAKKTPKRITVERKFGFNEDWEPQPRWYEAGRTLAVTDDRKRLETEAGVCSTACAETALAEGWARPTGPAPKTAAAGRRSRASGPAKPSS